MKFCPNCGALLEGKMVCDCGYNVETGEVDDRVFEEFKEKESARYEMSCDNMSMFGTGSMGIEIAPPGQVIFNKDNDNYKSEELAELMKRFAEEEEIR